METKPDFISQQFSIWFVFAHRVMGISPRQFWDLTPHEFILLVQSIMPFEISEGGMRKEQLAELMKQYPDSFS